MTSGSPSRRNDAELSGCQVCGRPSGAGPAYPILICPECGHAATELATKAISLQALKDGPQAVACIACELVTMVIEPGMVCQACQRPPLDVNDQLRARFAQSGPGDPADAPCVGCGYYVTKPNPPSPPLDLLVDCQGCGDQFAIPEADFRAGYGMRVRCGGCGFVTVIPKTVWCPKCGLHLRSRGIPELIRDANQKTPAISGTTAGRSDGCEIGILFDIDALGGGSYGQKAYKILFGSLDPQRMKGCSFHDGDTNATLAGKANLYCIAIRSPEPAKINYVRGVLSARTDDGLLTVNRRFIEGDITMREPLGPFGDVDEAGNLVVEPYDVTRASWTEGTAWKVVTRRRVRPWRRWSSRRR